MVMLLKDFGRAARMMLRHRRSQEEHWNEMDFPASVLGERQQALRSRTRLTTSRLRPPLAARPPPLTSLQENLRTSCVHCLCRREGRNPLTLKRSEL
ncbi:hypothetical protein SKAU_G00317880 [Synaphobranchus kaupii]|uniref:Uncharacterized protein n=1 Tax=Synaphobranchus kaupii TaxID=118154 RepID=A0A9Q1ET74_SYNKA|nr:hypothetical protein SKAU_G00317880 [Synaphobranchus kaupii]